uniref:ABM domain-containing protein n=1 Tax=Thermosporothrix sp. COM3 TaxID=2490863 RepID=A0A455SKK7_9CHLR|nr:hypothetical protein KTC_03450 [Thermosporothrix sp. COM3]
MYIAVNKIPVPAGHEQAVAEGFKKALPGMKRFSGFLGLELWKSPDGSIQAVSRWTTKEALDEYLNDELFKRHHEGTESKGHGHNLVSYYECEVLA